MNQFSAPDPKLGLHNCEGTSESCQYLDNDTVTNHVKAYEWISYKFVFTQVAITRTLPDHIEIWLLWDPFLAPIDCKLACKIVVASSTFIYFDFITTLTSTTLYYFTFVPLPIEKVSYSQCRCVYFYHARLIETWVLVPVVPLKRHQRLEDLHLLKNLLQSLFWSLGNGWWRGGEWFYGGSG